MGHLEEIITLFLLKSEETPLFLRFSYMHNVDKPTDHSLEEGSFLAKSSHKAFPCFLSLSWHMGSSFSSLEMTVFFFCNKYKRVDFKCPQHKSKLRLIGLVAPRCVYLNHHTVHSLELTQERKTGWEVGEGGGLEEGSRGTGGRGEGEERDPPCRSFQTLATMSTKCVFRLLSFGWKK